jgi:small subunit ribosomal protein S9
MAAAKKDYFAAVGRRKRSIARVRLYKGKGQMTVNARPIEEYFKDIASATYLRPLELTGNVGKYYATAKITGGGRLGQVGAFLLGLSRALVSADEKYKSALHPAKLLTRDPREKERRKFGLAQAARARKQSPKR